jgi:ABC-type nitrate/sulfonate/bicarbonate transport system substrate-binding protein
MGTRKKWVAGILATGVMGAMLSGVASPAQALTDIKVALGPYNSIGAIQYAQDSGIMRRNNLNISEFVVLPAPPPAIAALASGQVQFAYTPTIPAINSYENAGINLRIVAPADGYRRSDLVKAKKDDAFAAGMDDTGVCVNPSSGIRRWKNLEGKTVSVPARGAQAEVTIAQAVKDDGGDSSKINWVTLTFPEVVPSVKNGQVDAGFTVEPFGGICKSEGMKNLGSPGIAFFDVEQAIGVWVTTAEYASKNPKVVADFQKAMYQTHQYAMKSTANMRKVILASTKITELSAKDALAANPPYYPMQVTRVDVTRPAQKMFELGFLDKKADVAGLLAKQYRK